MLKKNRRVTQLLAFGLVICLVTGCGTGAAPGATTPSATPDPLLGGIQSSMLGLEPGDNQPLDQAEQDTTNLLRDSSGARAALGSQAEAVFQKMDQARLAAVQELMTRASSTSSQAPTAEQMLALNGLLDMLGVSALASMDYQIVSWGLSLGMLAGTPLLMENAPRDAAGNASLPAMEVVTTTQDDVAIYLSLTPRMMGSRMEADVEMIVSVSTPIAYEETTKGHLGMELCPDAEGNVPLQFSFESGSNMNGGGMQMAANSQVTGHVDDEANLTNFDLQTTSSGAHQPGLGARNGTPNQFVEASLNINGSMTDPQATTMTGSFTRASSQADLPFANSMAAVLGSLNVVMTTLSLMIAEMKWKDGFCLEVTVPDLGAGTKTVEPNSETSFTAHVRHKFEGVELNVPLIATLSSGQVSVNPSGSKLPAPADFTYKAADQVDQAATVNLETRSRRGVAKLDLQFSTKRKAYELEFDSTIVTNTFSLSGRSGPVNVTQHVRTVVPLEWSEQEQAYTGQASLDYVLFDVPAIIGYGGDAGPFIPCPNEVSATGGTFRVLQLKGLTGGSSSQPGQMQVSGLELTIDPGTTVESIKPVCPPPAIVPPGFLFPLPTWPVNFNTMHSKETLTGSAPFIIKDWVAGSGSSLAVKTYSVSQPFTAVMKITENTTITLVQK